MPAKKAKTVYICQQCGHESLRWAGQCPECGEWNTLVEQIKETRRAGNGLDAGGLRTKPQSLRDVNVDTFKRWMLPMEEFNRVLGGGVVPGSLVLIGGDPGIGKCLVGSTRVLDPATGAYLPIRDWKHGLRHVLSLDVTAQHLSPQSVSSFLDQGVRPIVEVKTRLGRTLRCTATHPLLTPDGWQPVNALVPGSRIAAPRALPYFGSAAMPEHEVRLAAYLLSDGSATSSVNVTTALPEIEEDLARIAHAFGMKLSIYSKPNNRAKMIRFVQPLGERAEARKEISQVLRTHQAKAGLSWAAWARKANVSYGMIRHWRAGSAAPSAAELERLACAAHVSVDALAPAARNLAEMTTPVARFAESIGVRYATAKTKTVPDCIFRLPRQQLAEFLKILFSCDGSVYVNSGGQQGISYSTISEQLAQDVSHLLLRFGFVSKLRTKQSTVQNSPYIAYEIQLLGLNDIKRFLAEIGIFGRSKAVAQIDAMPLPRLSSTQRDTIPTGGAFWAHLRDLSKGASFKKISSKVGVKLHYHRDERPLCRSTVAALAGAYSSEYFNALAHGDVYWDEIHSIMPAGEEHVYDLSVPSHANFVANDLIVHNSTLLLQVAALIADNVGPVLYASAEESVQQIKMRAGRLGIDSPNVYLLSETNLDVIIQELQELKPRAAIVDSIQTVFLEDLVSAAGSVSQVREGASRLQHVAKANGVPIFIVGHVTKSGSIAGPRVLEHIVDVVLYLEGDRFHAFRLLRSTKNRFGATNEVGVFAMEQGGMVEVLNPSEAFLADRAQNFAGSAIAVTMEGSRPLLVEIQGLTSTTSFALPRRTGNGVDMNRLLLMVAVLSKRMGMNLSNQDVFVNVIGGLKISEPAADLSLAVAIASSYRDVPVPVDMVIMGEVGLSGELRSVSQAERRLAEAAKLGYRRCVVPHSLLKRVAVPPGLELLGARNLGEALDAALRR